jgi:hypothetical protein
MLERQHPDDWDTSRRNSETIEKHLRPALPNARVFNSGTQTFTSGVNAAVTFNSERWDVGGFHSTSANTSRLTAPITGVYQITGYFGFAANATGYRRVFIKLNGGTLIAVQDVNATGAGSEAYLTINAFYRLVRGDYVELFAEQNSGGNLNSVSAGNFSPEFSIVRLGGYTHEGVA